MVQRVCGMYTRTQAHILIQVHGDAYTYTHRVIAWFCR